jgi:hypothetical protein
MSLEDAVARIKDFVGTRYDESVVASLVAAYESGQIRAGSVRLKKRPKDGETKTAALVAANNQTSPPATTTAV